MNIHEHQAKQILKKYGATVPEGVFALSVDELVEKAKTLNEHSSESEKFNILGQLQSLQRIKKSGELESSYKEQEKLTQDGKPKT